MWLLSPAGRRRQERRKVAGNGESLRNVSSREGWASRTRRNAQTRTLSGGGEEPEKWWGLKSPLKKKKSNIKKDTVTYTHSKPPSSGGRKLSLLSHPHVTHRQIHGPTQLPSYRYETNSCFWGGVGPGKGNSGSGAGNL